MTKFFEALYYFSFVVCLFACSYLALILGA